MDSPNSWHRMMAGATWESPRLYTFPAMVTSPLSMLNRSTKPLTFQPFAHEMGISSHPAQIAPLHVRSMIVRNGKIKHQPPSHARSCREEAHSCTIPSAGRRTFRTSNRLLHQNRRHGPA